MRSDGLKRTFAKGLTVENCATKDPLGVHALKRTSVPYPNLARDAPVRKTTKSSVFTPLEGRIPLRYRPDSKVTAGFFGFPRREQWRKRIVYSGGRNCFHLGS